MLPSPPPGESPICPRMRRVLVNSTEGMVCAGAVVEETALEPGELLLFSQGGARIYLKNSGEVVINGQVFAAEEGE